MRRLYAKTWILALAFVLALGRAPLCLAETSSEPSPTTPTEGQPSPAESGIPTNAQVELPPPPPPPQQDRKNSNGAAIAMAIVGAALAGASCVMLMAQAAKEQDPAKKKELMAQALQQCAQAAQSAANAAQNKDNGKKLQDTGEPKGAQLKTDFAQKGAPAKSDSKMPSLQPTAAPEAPPTEVAETPAEVPAAETAAGVVEPSAFDAKPEGDTVLQAAAESWTTLKPIETGKVSFNDGAKVGGTSPGSGPNGSLLGASTPPGNPSAQTGGADLDTKLNGKLSALSAAKGKGAIAGTHADGGAGSGIETTDGGKGSSASGMEGFDSILSSILGGGAAGAAAGAPPEDILIFTRNSEDEGPLPNIFQYAAYRYRKASQDEQRVRFGRKPPPGTEPLLSDDNEEQDRDPAASKIAKKAKSPARARQGRPARAGASKVGDRIAAALSPAPKPPR